MIHLINRAVARGRDGGERRDRILAVARRLFLERGYDNVGMREIARSAGISPALIYREGWTKADLLAELILELNADQIAMVQAMPLPEGGAPIDRVLAVLERLYAFDIAQKDLRRLGAAYGWLWRSEHETRSVSQVDEMLMPLRSILRGMNLEPIEPRVMGIWAVYSMSFRNAVFIDADVSACLERVRPIISLLLASQTAAP